MIVAGWLCKSFFRQEESLAAKPTHYRSPDDALNEVPSDRYPPVAAAKASFSTSIAFRMEKHPRLPSRKKRARGSRRPDTLAGIFEAGVVLMPKAAVGMRPIAIYEEISRGTLNSGTASAASWSAGSGP